MFLYLVEHVSETNNGGGKKHSTPHLCSQNAALLVELNLDELSEAGRVVVLECDSVSKALQQRVAAQHPAFQVPDVNRQRVSTDRGFSAEVGLRRLLRCSTPVSSRVAGF